MNLTEPAVDPTEPDADKHDACWYHAAEFHLFKYRSFDRSRFEEKSTHPQPARCTRARHRPPAAPGLGLALGARRAAA